VSSSQGPKKLRVYEVARDLGMSSEAVLQIVRRLGIEVKNHMSTLLPETVQQVQAEIGKEKTAVKEELHRQHEHELQRAREERARASAAAAAAAAPPGTSSASAPSAPGGPRPMTPPRPGGPGMGPRPGGPGMGPRPGGPGMGPRPGGPGMGPRPGGPGMGPRPGMGGPGMGGPGPGRGPQPHGFRRRDRKKKKTVDERLVAESVRKTLASLDQGARRRHHHREDEGAEAATQESKTIRATEFITVAELANLLEVKPQEVITTCMRLGMMANMNKRLDRDSIEAVADEFGYGVEFVSEYVDQAEETAEAGGEHVAPRPPVVTVMGHVDHGKTSLLDHIRKTNVIAGEAGGITQHIGAYEVKLPGGRVITFLDTPGHEAFTAMRARGAQVTDLVVLVVAADDRVMPQTIEAIDHAKAAAVPILVAINKIDLPGARPDLVKQDLAGRGVVVEEFGGKTVAVEVSAKKGTNVDRLLEMIGLQADLLDLKADPTRRARGAVLEARVEQGRGIVVSVLVQSGTLRVGDPFVAGHRWGRVRAMFDERGRTVKSAGPSTPVEVLGWDGAPGAGDIFLAFEDEREARDLASKRQALHREHEFNAASKMRLVDFRARMEQGETSELKMIIKGDVDGSVEALSESLTKLSTAEVQVRIIRQSVGQVSEGDVLLAAASDAIIIAFHTKPDPRARDLAEREKVEIRLYDIIYKAVEEVKSALEGLLKPELRESVTGTAEVRQVFRLSKAGTVAGCMVTSGTIPRTGKVRQLRGGGVEWTGRIAALKRFKDDVREVASGFECGISLEGHDDVKVGDIIESFIIEELARTL
jgi:translation initiation factor IF-2